MVSEGNVTESSHHLDREKLDLSGGKIGYIYQHTPIELILAHGLTPVLITGSTRIESGYESSLQTFACAYSRNIFSQRVAGLLDDISGFIFPGNTCDSLQNVGDVWKHRFPDDHVFRLTFPAGRVDEESITFLVHELRNLSRVLQQVYGVSCSEHQIKKTMDMVNEWRVSAQLLYAIRLIHPSSLSYPELVSRMRGFLLRPVYEEVDDIRKFAKELAGVVGKESLLLTLNEVHEALPQQRLTQLSLEFEESPPRIVVAGGMIDPERIAKLFSEVEETHPHLLLTDLFSLGYKMVFTPIARQEGDLFYEIAKATLSAPLEPTQEGLSQRLAFLRDFLKTFKIDGLVVFEQSFCDPDEFEAPSLEAAAKDVGVKSIRVPTDPELSDRERILTRIQSFIETLGGMN